MSATVKRQIRPVLELFNCKENRNKFCIPLTLATARDLEGTF